MIEISYSAIEFWFCIVFIAVAGIQILYYLFFYLRICIVKRKPLQVIEEEPVSVIICAKNEEENLRKFLPSILNQTYKTYEVIVVNDCSEDDSEFVLNDFLEKYPNKLRVSTIKKDRKFSHGKKLAITIGIKAAKYDKILFTDADCKPQSDKWIHAMQQQFRDKTEIVLGYGGYIQKTGLLDKLVRYDTYSIAVNYMSFAHAGLPYMGVGRNLAYTKNIYNESSKFTTHYHISSGDDDLFVSEVGRKENTSIVLSQESFTRSEQVSSFKYWKYQKMRHLTTSPHYKFIYKFLLCLEPFSREMFYLCAIVYCITLPEIFFLPIVILFGCRMFLFLLLSILNTRRLQEKDLWIYALPFDIYLPIQIGLLHLRNRIHPLKKNQW
ncbi:MAG: glycosyltransferase [Bacteroidales bacterium]|nr:glycosyltransferase [Bacteroidales bacterium]